jgi:poly(A) polymerase
VRGLDGLDGAAPVRLARESLPQDGERWLVGGALRDAALGRPVVDVDLAVAEGEEEVARGLADAAGGDLFQLSEEFAAWRVLAPGGRWHLDVVRLRGGIESDLAGRDFTVNAMARRLEGGEVVDPYGGRSDLEGRLLRAVGEESFAADPLRLLRAARLAADLGFEIDPRTADLARAAAGRAAEPSGERQFRELRLLVSGADPMRGLGLLDALGLTPAVLPELEVLRGVEQNPYHHLDVHGHTLAVLEQLVELEDRGRLGEVFGGDLAELADELDRPLADGLTRREALRFGALVHDLGKPETRAITDEGRILFIGHDVAGARIVAAMCRRFRTSRELRRFLEALTLQHLRLGFLVHEMPLSRRRVFDYLEATDPVAVEVTLLSVADRLATRGEKTRDQAVEAHLALARELMRDALDWRRQGPPVPPMAGEALMAALGLEPGPEVGRLLRELAAATYAGEVASPEDALELARRKRLK